MTFALALALLKRHRDIALIAGAVLLVTISAWQISAWDGRRIEAAETRGANSVRFTAALYASRYTADSAKYAERLRIARTKAEEAERRAGIRARSDVATDALYESLRRLSDSAQADSTVKALEVAAKAVAVENDSLKHDIVTLISTHVAERAASDSVHANDQRALVAQTVITAAKDDTIAAVTQQRDARVKKSTVVKIAGAAVGGTFAVIKWVLPLVKGN